MHMHTVDFPPKNIGTALAKKRKKKKCSMMKTRDSNGIIVKPTQ